MKKKTISFTIITLIILLAGLSYYIINSMLWTNTNAAMETKPAVGSSFSLKSLIADKTIDLNSEDINSLIKFYAPKLENATCSIKDSKIYFYIPVKYHGINLLLSTSGKIEYADSAICYYPANFKVGRLPIPKSLVFSYIKKYAAVNSEKKRIEIDSSKLPVQIESLELKDDVLQIKLGKLGASSTIPTPSSPSTQKQSGNQQKTTKPAAPSTNNENSDLLERTSSQLKTVYSKVKTTNEKQIIQQIQTTVNKMLQDPDYSYKNDASAILSKYGKLTAAEKSDLKGSIISYMDFDTLLNFKETFGL